MIQKVELVSAANDELQKSATSYVVHIGKLNEYIDDLWKWNEEETKLWKQFEAKLNSLHSLVWD